MGNDAVEGYLPVGIGARRLQKTLDHPGVSDFPRTVGAGLPVGAFGREVNLSVLDYHLLHQTAVHLADKCPVVGVGELGPRESGKYQSVEQQDDEQAPEQSHEGVALGRCRGLAVLFVRLFHDVFECVKIVISRRSALFVRE